jgi:hypothetical protein
MIKGNATLIECSKANEVREAFLIVGSHSKFLKEQGLSDLNIDKKSVEQDERSHMLDPSTGPDHRRIKDNLHAL